MNFSTWIMAFASKLGSSLPMIVLLIVGLFILQKVLRNFGVLTGKLKYRWLLYIVAVFVSPLILMLDNGDMERFLVIWGYVYHISLLFFLVVLIAWIVSLTPLNPQRRRHEADDSRIE